jgi:hypothetical protein
LIPILSGLGGVLAGALLTAYAVRRHRLAHGALAPPPEPQCFQPAGPAEVRSEEDAGAERNGITLLGHALRAPLARLRRTDGCPPEALEEIERIAWQARMLVSRPRPMKAKPVSPISLLQEAAEQVEKLRLGKVPVSWTLRNRQPVHLDPDRSRGAFRELLATVADTAGEEGRVGIRIVPGSNPGYPVRVEIEIGRRGSEPDPLALLVAGRLLEGQGARVEVDGQRIGIALRSTPVEAAQTPSNR